MRKVLSLCLLLLCLVSLAWGEHPDGTLSGAVTDPAGAVVANVSVRIEHWEGRTASSPAELKQDVALTTNADGHYSMDLKPGIYDVFFSSQLFSPVAKRLKIDAGKTVHFSPKLKFDPTGKFVEVR